MEIQRPRTTAPATYQLLLPLELPESLEPQVRLPSISSAPTVLPHQVWGTLPATERRQAQQVFIQVIQEVLDNGDRD
jgi:hypothetical protein